MSNIQEMIKEYIEGITYQSHSEFTYNYRVEQVGDNDYEVYIINSFAEIIYIFKDVVEEAYEGDDVGYSAYVDFLSCKIVPFEADIDTKYYLDKLNKYIERCGLVSRILDSVDVPADPLERTYF